MPDLFDSLGHCRFDDVAIPITGYRLQGGQRKKVHSYPHVNSGKAEKLGRELYSIHIQALFDRSLEGWNYIDVWPKSLDSLIEKFEAGVSADLFLPTRGTLKCFCDNWSVDMAATLRSGERAELSFLEDDSDSFRLKAFSKSDPGSIRTTGLTLAEMRALHNAELTEEDKSIFDKIDDAVNTVRGVLDTAEGKANLVLSKVERLINLCAEAEDRLSIIQNPRSYPLFEAVKQLWDSARKVADDVKGKRSPIQKFVVPVKMALPQVAAAIYGDASRGQDILDLNFFDDSFAIQAGTVVRYYPDA